MAERTGGDLVEAVAAALQPRLADLTETERETVEALTRSIVAKLLHEPTARLKEAAGTARGELFADALAALFDLPEPDAETEA